MNSIYRDNMHKMIVRNNIAKIAHDMKIPMDEAVQRIRDNTDQLVRDWNRAVKQSKGDSNRY